MGIVFTPSGKIKSALEDLKCRAIKAYWGLRKKLGPFFSLYPLETIKLFDSLIKPIILYGSDFLGLLPSRKYDKIEKLNMFCRHLLGVGKKTTTNGVLLEIGRTPLNLYAKKSAIKNWERIRNEN